jgi:hypothetical protein
VNKEDGDGSARPDGVRKFTAPAVFLLRAFVEQNERGMRRGSAARARALFKTAEARGEEPQHEWGASPAVSA